MPPVRRGQYVPAPSLKKLQQRVEELDREKANASTVGGISTALKSKAKASDLEEIKDKLPE